MSDNFFTIFDTYFKCCWKRNCCFAAKDYDEKRNYDDINRIRNDIIGNGDVSPYSFDDLSNPLTPVTNSSSSSSLSTDTITYKRPKVKSYVSIIPANYYTD